MSGERRWPPKFQIDDAAARYIANHGGRFYIWSEAVGAGKLGVIKTSLDPPSLEGMSFSHSQLENVLDVYVNEAMRVIDVFVDETIEPPVVWDLTYHRLPHRHIRALADPPPFRVGYDA